MTVSIKIKLFLQHKFQATRSFHSQDDQFFVIFSKIRSQFLDSSRTHIFNYLFLFVFFPLQIIKHAGDVNLKVFLYEGVNKNYLLPPLMAQFDIVLVTFTTLRSEISFVSILMKLCPVTDISVDFVSF